MRAPNYDERFYASGVLQRAREAASRQESCVAGERRRQRDSAAGATSGLLRHVRALLVLYPPTTDANVNFERFKAVLEKFSLHIVSSAWRRYLSRS